MLTLGLRSYRSSNLVLDLKMWEKFESNLPVCISLSTKIGLFFERNAIDNKDSQIYNRYKLHLSVHTDIRQHNQHNVQVSVTI